MISKVCSCQWSIATRVNNRTSLTSHNGRIVFACADPYFPTESVPRLELSETKRLLHWVPKRDVCACRFHNHPDIGVVLSSIYLSNMIL